MAIKPTKPRVRIIFDENRSPEEVRVILKPSNGRTKIFEEFGNMVSVEADDAKDEIYAIRLNCHALGGKIYEESLIEVIAMLQRRLKVSKDFLSQSNLKLIRQCTDLLSKSKIDKWAENTRSARRVVWGELHELIENAEEYYFNSKPVANSANLKDSPSPVVKLKEFIRSKDPNTDQVKFIKEAILFSLNNVAARSGQIINFIAKFIDLNERAFVKIVNESIEDCLDNYLYWNVLTQRLYFESDQPEETIKFAECCKSLFEKLATNGAENQNHDQIDEETNIKNRLLDYIVSMIDVLPKEDWEKILNILKSIQTNNILEQDKLRVGFSLQQCNDKINPAIPVPKKSAEMKLYHWDEFDQEAKVAKVASDEVFKLEPKKADAWDGGWYEVGYDPPKKAYPAKSFMDELINEGIEEAPQADKKIEIMSADEIKEKLAAEVSKFKMPAGSSLRPIIKVAKFDLNAQKALDNIEVEFEVKE